MPKTLADGKRKAVLLASRPVDVNAITAVEANAGDDISDYVLTTSVVGPSGSDTFNEKVWSSQGNVEDFGASNFSGNFITIHRYFDAADGQPDPATDTTWTALKEKGTPVRLLTRLAGKDASEDFAAGDEYRYMEYITDDPVEESGDGYIKVRIPLGYQGVHSLDQVIV